MRLIIGTSNKNKVLEIKNILKNQEEKKIKKFASNIFSLSDLNNEIEIDEFGTTLHQNALIKAECLSKLYPKDIILTDDSGIFVNELSGQPGVYSARYANDMKEYENNKDYQNNKKLLSNLKKTKNRTAHYKTTMCLIIPNKEPVFFSGKLNGEIAIDIDSKNGFGYDPIFIVDGQRLNHLTVEEKNKISHRKIALEKTINYLINCFNSEL